MKGTDVTDEALQHARDFLEITSGITWSPDDDELLTTCPRHQLIRLVAWYGEIRAIGGGKPGKVTSAKREAALHAEPPQPVGEPTAAVQPKGDSREGI